MRRNILNFVGISPVRETLLGQVEGASDDTRRKWIATMRRLERKLPETEARQFKERVRLLH
jgi:hypothetical protein